MAWFSARTLHASWDFMLKFGRSRLSSIVASATIRLTLFDHCLQLVYLELKIFQNQFHLICALCRTDRLHKWIDRSSFAKPLSMLFVEIDGTLDLSGVTCD